MIVEEGYLKGAITGFDTQGTVYEFIDGNTWIQAQVKQYSPYTLMPHAKVIGHNGRFYIEIEGMKEGAEVKRKSS